MGDIMAFLNFNSFMSQIVCSKGCGHCFILYIRNMTKQISRMLFLNFNMETFDMHASVTCSMFHMSDRSNFANVIESFVDCSCWKYIAWTANVLTMFLWWESLADWICWSFIIRAIIVWISHLLKSSTRSFFFNVNFGTNYEHPDMHTDFRHCTLIVSLERRIENKWRVTGGRKG
jgi:hypothetical protein